MHNECDYLMKYSLYISFLVTSEHGGGLYIVQLTLITTWDNL